MHSRGRGGPPTRELHPRRAHSPDERAAIYRLRYRVFAEELGRTGHAGLDHGRRWIREDADEADDTAHYYFGTPRRALGAVRVRYWPAGGLDPALVRRNSLDLLPLAGCGCIGLDLLAVDRAARGGAHIASLATRVIEDFTLGRAVHAAVMDCVPGLARLWMGLGFRPYGGRLIEKDDAVTIPMVGLPSDLDHLRRIRSPWYPALLGAGRAGRLPRLDPAPFHAAFASQSRVIHEPEQVRRAVVSALRDSFGAERRLDLASGGLVLGVPAGVRLARRGVRQHEAYLVLSGRFEASGSGAAPASYRRGDVLGLEELRDRAPASGDVAAVVSSRVLALSGRGVARLIAGASDPAASEAAAESACTGSPDRLRLVPARVGPGDRATL